MVNVHSITIQIAILIKRAAQTVTSPETIIPARMSNPSPFELIGTGFHSRQVLPLALVSLHLALGPPPINCMNPTVANSTIVYVVMKLILELHKD